MQGKGLALGALIFCAALLGGCGGGGGGQSASGQSTASPAPGQSTEPASASPALQKLKEDTERVREERAQAEQQSSKAPQAKEGSKASPKPQPPAHPKDTHHDSGGGSAQFAHQGGDNSIQESGQEASAAQRDQAAAVLHAYLDARVAGNWEEACFYLSASAVSLLERFAQRYGKDKGITSCPQVLEALSQGSSQGALEAAARADVGSLRIEGDHGFLLYRGAGGQSYVIAVVSEGGAWKVGAVDGTGGI